VTGDGRPARRGAEAGARPRPAPAPAPRQKKKNANRPPLAPRLLKRWFTMVL
jgi:hypothetical protein